jgi:hypothetical protein
MEIDTIGVTHNGDLHDSESGVYSRTFPQLPSIYK